MIALVTPRLVLRPWTPDDVDALTGLAPGDAGEPSPSQRARAFLAANDQRWQHHGLGSLAVERADSVIGGVGVSPRGQGPARTGGGHRGDSPRIGWTLLPAVRGCGYATEAATAVTDWLFGELQPSRLVALLSPKDEPSRRVAGRLGMTLDRRLVSPELGGWLDLFCLERHHWDVS